MAKKPQTVHEVELSMSGVSKIVVSSNSMFLGIASKGAPFKKGVAVFMVDHEEEVGEDFHVYYFYVTHALNDIDVSKEFSRGLLYMTSYEEMMGGGELAHVFRLFGNPDEEGATGWN